MSRAALPPMLEGDRGSIVHVASESARLPAVFNPDYAAAKLAVLSMSKALAAEFTAPMREVERRHSRNDPHAAV